MTKTSFATLAKKSDLSTTYCGKTKTMFVTGENTKVKAFIRVRNLLGKAAHNFAIKQR